jgi:glycosyltransferase involved in cell wall biosynthesis
MTHEDNNDIYKTKNMLRNLDIVIITHVFVTGPPQELEEYLKDKVNTLMFIGHPFYYANDIRSYYRTYCNGKIINKKKARIWEVPELILYFKDIVYTLIWIINSKKGYDICVGADPLNAFAGILLKKIKKVNKVILYTIDYVPKRFNNILLNTLYCWLDSYCVKHSDQIWNLSQRMTEEREKKGVPNNGNQIVVPIGVHFSRINRLSVENINRRHIVYMGHLRRKQGLELIFEALPKTIEKVPDVKLIIVGTGQFEKKLKRMCKTLEIEEYIEFKGYIEDHRDVEKILSKCAVGLAVYEPDPDSFTWYTDPSKPKQYLACGLPVIITRVPWIAEEIERMTMGIVINYHKGELTDAIVRLLTDDIYFETCRKNAIKFASELEWDTIFDSVFSKY